ncbi:hypothetical protein ZOSMA_69G00370 [Zostera marina]|uniref:Polyadenylate-binding protein 1-B-binding protein n=1 Tax=Zostera marina TaxID=29655 RepID=A0A0K9NTQ6_ZOSMR|nr:hypothetical protein ZOSMA_69G00370 [Zostera marina]
MDLGGVEERQEQTLVSILQDSIAIPRSSPRTFSLITLILIFPLSFAVLAHTLFTHPILLQLESEKSSSSSDPQKWMLLFLYQFVYLILLFTFSLLSTAAVVFTVASLYSSKPISFSSTLSAIPPVFSRLMHTFGWVSAIMALYHLAFALVILVLLLVAHKGIAFILLASLVVLGFVVIHIYIACVWHLASVVTVLEPIHGLGAMNKSMELLKGKTRMAAGLVLGYLAVCAVISLVFRAVVVQGGEEGWIGSGIVVKVVVGGVLVAALVVINLTGLLVQSVFYYVCKNFHHESIDKTALYDHLGGYLGEYVPLKSSIQMETL